MMQMARNLTDHGDGFLRGKTHLILDRDTRYTKTFCSALEREGVDTFQLPPRSPNLNAFAERFVRSIKHECLNRMIFVSQAQLRYSIGQFMAHYHGERNHQGVGNQLLRPVAQHQCVGEAVRRRRRLGGLLNCTMLPPPDPFRSTSFGHYGLATGRHEFTRRCRRAGRSSAHASVTWSSSGGPYCP